MERKNRPQTSLTTGSAPTLGPVRNAAASCGSSHAFPAAANDRARAPRHSAATHREPGLDDPADNLGSRPFHRAANRRPSKRLAPSRRRNAHRTPPARVLSAKRPRFPCRSLAKPIMLASRGSKPKRRQCEAALHKAHSGVSANLPAPPFNPASMRSAPARRHIRAADLTEASRFANHVKRDS